MFGNNRMLCIMKAILPYIPPSSRKLISILIFMAQIQEAMQMFQEINSLTSYSPEQSDFNIMEILKKNCTPKEREMFENYENMMQMFQMFQEFQGSQNCHEENPSNTTDGSNSSLSDLANIPSKGSTPFNPSDLLRSMLTPEQEELFSLFQGHSIEESASNENEM